MGRSHVIYQSPAGMNISALAQETMCYIGQQLVFTEAEQVINHLSGAAVNAKQIERVCHHYGQALEDENQQVIAQQVYKEYRAEQVDQRHYVSVDGAMYLTREESWKENKLGHRGADASTGSMNGQRSARAGPCSPTLRMFPIWGIIKTSPPR